MGAASVSCRPRPRLDQWRLRNRGLKKQRHDVPAARKNILANYVALSCVVVSGTREVFPMLKFVLGALVTIAMVGGAIAADLPRPQPPPPYAAPVGKAPFWGKTPVVARY